MDVLRFRAPGRALPLADLLARAAPEMDGEALARGLREGALRVRVAGGPALRDGLFRVEAGTLIEWTNPPRGIERSALPGRAQSVGSADTRYLALAPAPPWSAGAFANARAPEEAAVLAFERGEVHDGVAELRLDFPGGSADTVRRRLAEAGFPILGDTRFGGILVEAGLRLRAASGADHSQRTWWPSEPIFAPDVASPGRGRENARLRVSESSLRALARGHPWVLTDSETGDTGQFRSGALVWIAGRPGVAAGTPQMLARIEGPGGVAARLWARGVSHPREAPSVEARVARALQQRASLLAGAGQVDGTDAFRLLHGEADGLPGLAVDRLGPLLRMVVTGRSCEGFEVRALDALVRSLSHELGSDPPVVRVVHLRERPAGPLRAVELIRGKLPPTLPGRIGVERFCVRERGLSFWVDPGLAQPEQPALGIGLFPDQRENRARLAELATRGGRWLNLFAHTGAFSVALLAGGAEEVVSVDLSAAYLRWLEENLALNGLCDARHRTVRGDGRRVLARLPDAERFEGIVIDPPTAAAAGRRFWSVRRDLPPLVETALRRLVPGGALLVCRNDRAARGTLGRLVREAATRASVGLSRVDPAPSGSDYPALQGFPEGDPFEGLLAQRAGRWAAIGKRHA